MMNGITILPSKCTEDTTWPEKDTDSKPLTPLDSSCCPPQGMGPDPTLLSRKEVDALYEMLAFIVEIFSTSPLLEGIEYIITGGSLLGAVRQHSILFCDDDIDIAIIGEEAYERVVKELPILLEKTKKFHYTRRPWEGGDRIRHMKYNTVFVDIFTIRRYSSMVELHSVIGVKENGKAQPTSYFKTIYDTIRSALSVSCQLSKSSSDLDQDCNGERQVACTAGSSRFIADNIFPFYHFNTRKAMELWPKECYLPYELFPILTNYKMGPVVGCSGPNMPVVLLERAFGRDCFDVYYPSFSHSLGRKIQSLKQYQVEEVPTEQEKLSATTCLLIKGQTERSGADTSMQQMSQCSSSTSNIQAAADGDDRRPISAHNLPGGTWQGGVKKKLDAEHYIPMQSITRAKRRGTFHNQSSLQTYLDEQRSAEYQRQHQHNCTDVHQQNGDGPSIIDSRDRCSSNTATYTDQIIPDRTVYMDGVFDLMHVGHLKAIEQCTRIGTRVIIGVTGDQDATGYKRQPIFSQQDRAALIAAVKGVNEVICPCPLIVTEDFMELYNIDLVVHGFSSEEDAQNQYEFFKEPMELGKFQRIDYYNELNTTDIIRKIQSEYS